MQSTNDYLAMLNVVAETSDMATLSKLDVEVSVAYGYMNVKYAQLEAMKDATIKKYEEDNPDVKHTNASLERYWNTTNNGQIMTKLKGELKALDTILKAVKNLLIRLSIENREIK